MCPVHIHLPEQGSLISLAQQQLISTIRQEIKIHFYLILEISFFKVYFSLVIKKKKAVLTGTTFIHTVQ